MATSKKVTLQRQVGPFKVWQWLVVIIVGVGLGLLIRRRMTTSPVSADTTNETLFVGTGEIPGGDLPPTQGSVGQQGQLIDFGSVKVLQQEQNRFFDELEKEFAGLDDIFTPVIERLEKITVPVERAERPTLGGAPGTPKVIPPTRKQQDDLQPFRNAVLSAYRLEGVKPPNVASIDRIALELKQGRKVSNLRRSIRRNERKQGRKTIAQSAEYWSNR